MKILRWTHFARTILAARLGQLKHPFKLTFIVTKECHSKCLNCQIWMVKPQNELTLDEIRSFARNSPYLSWVHFAGGEPTDREDFPDIAAAFVESCPSLVLLNFPTNGLKPKRIEAQVRTISKLKIPKFGVTVSVDGPPELNDKLRGIPGDFERATETVRRIKEIAGGPEVLVGMTLYQENCHLFEETLAALKSAIPGFTEHSLHVNIPHLSEHYYENKSSGISIGADTGKVVQELSRRRGIPRSGIDLIERLYHNAAKSYLSSRRTPLPCSAIYASCYLSERGEVFPCSIWNNPLGNIRENGYSLVPILQQSKAIEARTNVEAKNCPNCWTPCEAYQSILVSAPLGLLVGNKEAQS